ncbi:hypothetical protein CASFOL_030101 [Castilleja foliolosa]|uniref:Uncharacterized protein n=1 Tax=Castilleja foliolosa TaxID=1961234 RepID=A0ABD3CCV9_9LAMI
MGYKNDLLKIGKDGFAIIEEHMEKCKISGSNNKKYNVPQRPSVQSRKPCLYQYQPQQAHVYQVKPLPENETRFNMYEVSKGYSKRNSAATLY